MRCRSPGGDARTLFTIQLHLSENSLIGLTGVTISFESSETGIDVGDIPISMEQMS
jgi:hypothetical protein